MAVGYSSYVLALSAHDLVERFFSRALDRNCVKAGMGVKDGEMVSQGLSRHVGGCVCVCVQVSIVYVCVGEHMYMVCVYVCAGEHKCVVCVCAGEHCVCVCR